MLHEFLNGNRADLIARCRIKLSQRSISDAADVGRVHGIPLFLDQLIRTLQAEQTSEPMRSREVSGRAGGEASGSSELGASAALHGRELLQQGFTVDQVVHAYGDLCQAVTDLAFERNEAITVDEFRTLNRCLDNGIAGAVTEYTYGRDSAVTHHSVRAENERLGFLAHEVRNLVHTATLAVVAVKSGDAGLTGAMGAVLDRCLAGLRTLIDRALEDVRTNAGMPPRHELVRLADVVAETAGSASIEASTHEHRFTVSAVDQRLAVDVDRDVLLSVVWNLLQNAFKFTRPHTEVSLKAYAVADRILIDVQDHCGGLPPDAAEKMFTPFVQNGPNRSGLGLGLAICQRGVDANKGLLRVRNVPGSGCVFTVDLPRHELP
jgi:signal transduction histidine kinase